MRIRTANGVGLVCLWSALVIVLVVMSGSAFGQDKRSGRAIKSNTGKSTGVQQGSGMGKTNSKKDAGVTPLPVRRELEATIQTDPVFPVYVEADREPSNPRPLEPPRNLLSDGPGSNGSPNIPSLPSSGSGSSSPSEPPAMTKVFAYDCVCEKQEDGPHYFDPNPIFGCPDPSPGRYVLIYEKRLFQFFYEAYLEINDNDPRPDRSTICRTGIINKYTLLIYKWKQQTEPACGVKLPYMHLPYPQREEGTRDPASGTFNGNPSWSMQCGGN